MSNLSVIKSHFLKIFCLGLFLTGTISFSQNHKNILVLGDSNGALNYGWVNQLKKILPTYNIFNTSRPGNTIGFDNLDRVELNTLKNLDYYLKSAQDSLGRIDYVIMMLGTNDAKYIFKDRQKQVVVNMESLIARINDYDFNFKNKPQIVIMLPPPYGSDKILSKKYQGGSKRIKYIVKDFKRLAKKHDCDFVNVYKELKHVFYKYTKDGIHLDENGQKIIADLVAAKLEEKLIENKFGSDLMDIYLLIGQSNMAGRAPIESTDRDSINNVYLFTGKDKKPWEKTANPVNKYSTVRKDITMQKLGLGYGFAKELSAKRPDKNIGLVVNARGGTSIEEWGPGGKLYNAALNQTKKALKYGVLKGIVWHQGESNASNYQSYLPQIISLIQSFREDFNNKNLPFIAGELSSDDPIRNHFNEMILQLPKKIKNTQIITAEGTKTIDGTHFDSDSQKLLGKKYADEMLMLVGN